MIAFISWWCFVASHLSQQVVCFATAFWNCSNEWVKFSSFDVFKRSQRRFIWDLEEKKKVKALHSVPVDLLIDLHHLKKNCEERCRLQWVHRGTSSLERTHKKRMWNQDKRKKRLKKYLKHPLKAPKYPPPLMIINSGFGSALDRMAASTACRQYLSAFLLCHFFFFFLHPVPVGVGKNCPKYQRGGRVATDSKGVDHLCLIAGTARPPPVN